MSAMETCIDKKKEKSSSWHNSDKVCVFYVVTANHGRESGMKKKNKKQKKKQNKIDKTREPQV